MRTPSGQKWLRVGLVLGLTIYWGGLVWGQPAVRINEIATLRGHTSYIFDVAFSSNGTTLASSSSDGSVRLWDTSTQKVIATLRGHTSTVNCVAFAPNGNTLVTGSDDGTLILWDLTSNQQLASLRGHQGSVTALAFSPDGNTLLSGSTDTTIKIWNVETRQEFATLRGHSNGIYSLAVSADGTTLASASADNSVRLWNLSTRRQIATLSGHTGWVKDVAFSPDGSMVFSSSSDRTIKIWDVVTRQEIATFRGHTQEVDTILVTQDGKMLVSSSRDTTIRIWDIATRREVGMVRAHRESVFSIALSPNGTTLASGSVDSTAKLWSIMDEPSFQKQAIAQLLKERLYKVDGQWYVQLDPQVLSALGFSIGSNRSQVSGPKGSLEVSSAIGNNTLLLFSSQSVADVERRGLTNQVWLPLAALDKLTDLARLDSSRLNLQFSLSASLVPGEARPYSERLAVSVPLGEPRASYTAAEFSLKRAELIAANNRYVAAKTAQEVTRFNAEFSTELERIGSAIGSWVRTAVWVEQEIYLSPNNAPAFLGINSTQEQPFSRVGGPVLVSGQTVEQIAASGRYEPERYEPLSSLNSGITISNGVLSYTLSRTYSHSDGSPFTRQETLQFSLANTPSYTYRALLDGHLKKSVAKQSYQVKQELIAQAGVVREHLRDWLSLSVAIGGRAYVPANDMDLQEYLKLNVTNTLVSGPRSSLKVFAGEGSAVLFGEASRAALEAEGYIPQVYVPLGQLQTLGSSLSLQGGVVSLRLQRTFTAADGKAVTLTETVAVNVPTNLLKFTYQQAVSRHQQAQQAAAAIQKERQTAAHRLAVKQRNPEVVANFERRVSDMKDELEGIVTSELRWFDGIPHVSIQIFEILGIPIQRRGDKLVGPSGQIGIMSGRGSAITYSAQSEASLLAGEDGYSPGVWVPLNKLPTLDKKFNWNNATNSLGAVLERKVEDITLREVLSSGSVVRKQTGLTYQQAVSRQQAMLRAEQRFQQSYTAQVRKDMVNRVLRLVRMRTDTVAEADDIHSGYYYRFRSSKGIALWGGDPFKACVYLSATPFTLKDTMYSQYFQSYVAILDISGITVVVGLSDSYVCRMRWYGYGDPY